MSDRPLPRDGHPLGWRCKIVLERPLAALLLVLLGPLLLIIGVLVRLTTPGPALHRRRVVGLGGAEFDAFKFRSMVRNADELRGRDPRLRGHPIEGGKLRDDPRITPLGYWLRRTSLDELPQLYNVVRGQMSLVGPRMIAPPEVELVGASIHRRIEVKPGMTGLWQVSGRQELSFQERVRLDMFYIDHWSPWLDVSILLKTIPAVLRMKGAY
jgi:lipopolysaccharide/colanic/teichoic acid biosynthesis glycosyltransferase